MGRGGYSESGEVSNQVSASGERLHLDTTSKELLTLRNVHCRPLSVYETTSCVTIETNVVHGNAF